MLKSEQFHGVFRCPRQNSYMCRGSEFVHVTRWLLHANNFPCGLELQRGRLLDVSQDKNKDLDLELTYCGSAASDSAGESIGDWEGTAAVSHGGKSI